MPGTVTDTRNTNMGKTALPTESLWFDNEMITGNVLTEIYA